VFRAVYTKTQLRFRKNVANLAYREKRNIIQIYVAEPILGRNYKYGKLYSKSIPDLR